MASIDKDHTNRNSVTPKQMTEHSKASAEDVTNFHHNNEERHILPVPSVANKFGLTNDIRSREPDHPNQGSPSTADLIVKIQKNILDQDDYIERATNEKARLEEQLHALKEENKELASRYAQLGSEVKGMKSESQERKFFEKKGGSGGSN